ncbi:MAG: hypothetical protein N3G79_07050, partial [Sulfolobales archaeon]|nr:hypothetical protein [Sulfolobales archaeon]
IERWVNKRYNVYYQVLPLAQRPEQGRGSAKDVKVGAWVFADLDFKENVNKKDFEGCREGSDHELECYYEEGGKVIHIKRPPLTQVLEDVRSRLDEPTLVVDSGAGYHIYFKLKYEVDSQVISSILWYVVEKLGGDPQSKDLARILRLPGSVNPRVGRLCRVIYESLNELDPEELSRKIEAEKEKNYSTAVTTQKLRELNDSEILKIVELLKDAYKPGYRQSLVLFLSGWMAKANISPLSAVRIVKHLYDSTQDQDPLRTRLSAVVYSYKKAGVDVDAFASEIEQIAGSKPYGLEKEISEEEVKGRSGLQEIFEDVIGEERALAVIHELSEILQTLSPYKDSVIELVDYEKQLYA